MAQLAQDTEVAAREAVKRTGKKASDQLRSLLEKRKREDEIRERLAAFAEEMDRAREQRDISL